MKRTYNHLFFTLAFCLCAFLSVAQDCSTVMPATGSGASICAGDAAGADILFATAGECFSLGAPVIETATSDAVVAIPDNTDAQDACTSITLTNTDLITSLVVDVDINHTWVGDLTVELTSPAGTTVTLLSNIGGPGFGCSGNDIALIFDDAAALTYADLDGTCNNAPAAAGAFQSLDALSAFAGESAAGVWTLCAGDYVGGDTGSIVGFGITATTSSSLPVATPATPALYDAAGNLVSTTSPYNPVTAGAVDANVGGVYTFYAASVCPDCTGELVPIDFIVEGGIALACKSHLNISLDSNCEAAITAAVALTSPVFDLTSYTVSVTDADGNVLPDATITGKGEYTYSVEHLCSGNSCWGYITAEDKFAPTLVCPATRVVNCYDDPKPSFPTDYPTAFDNCGISPSPTTITYTESACIPAGTTLATGTNGVLAPANWTQALSDPDGTLTIGNDEIFLASPNPGSGAVESAQAILTAPIAGEICFDYDYISNDPGFEQFLSATLLATDGSQVNYVVEFGTAAGSACVPVNAGDLFALAVFATDGLFGNSEATITNLSYSLVDEVCEDDPCAAVQTRAYTFTAVDDCGNVSASCVAPVLIVRPAVADIVFPADLELECSGADSADPADLEALSGLNGFDVYPSVNDQVFELGTKICSYAVTYTDSNPIDLCGNTYKIIRNWSIVDWCGDEVSSGLQIIKFTDTTAPTITCPASVAVAANYTSCDATIQIPTPDYVEACSSPVTIDVTLPDGSAGYVGQTISIDAGADYIITYTATDDCGNVSDACTQAFTIVDETAPVAICDQYTVASLGTDGTAHVCASTIDDGSYDNCVEELVIKVKRMDAASNVDFADCVEFDCGDVADNPILVRMRVYDITGNFKENDSGARYSECMVEVEVQDKIDPVITCPPNKTLDCMAGTHPDATGYATGYDNCIDVNITYTDNANIDDCGEGTIFRTWKIEGTNVKCTQKITIERDANQFFTGDDVSTDDDDIDWPASLDVTCDSNNSNGSQTDPTEEGAGYPYLIGTDDDCANLFIGHEDKVLYDDPAACFKIVRTWKVIDWCQYEPNSSSTAGYWSQLQIIKIYDNTAPEITSCGDVILNDNDGSCSEDYDLIIGASDNCSGLSYEYSVDLDSDGVLDFNGSGLNDSHEFDLGTHTIYWTVTDDCDNAVECAHEVKVLDTKKPTPVCIVSLSTVVMPSSGTITLWDNDFESGSSFDDCSNPLQLAINGIGDGSGLLSAPPTDNQGNYIHGVTFDCNQLGEQLVQMWVIDDAGNYDYCVTSVFIQSTGACDGVIGANVANITGVIETEMNEEVEDVMVDVAGVGNPFMTSNSGLYEFLDLPLNNNYTVTPQKDVNPLNGVTTYDLVLISQHILGSQLLDSPYKVIAADANNSGYVSTLDIVGIRRVILNIDSEFQNNTSWRFVDMDFVFPNPVDPFQTTFPEVISINNFTNDELAADFVGVKIGDVNASAIPNNLLGAQTRNVDGTLALNVNDATISEGETFTVDFNAADFNNILGYQFTMNFDQDAVEFVDVTAGKLALGQDNFGFTMTDRGMITTSWNDFASVTAKDGEVLFSMTFKAITNVQLSNVLSISSNVTRAEAYNNSSDVLDVVMTFNTESGSVVAGGAFELFQNVPNPVVDATLISFNLPTASTATLTIMDVSGRTLKVLRGEFAQGYNEVALDRADLQGTGVLYYQLDTPTDTASKKMILLD